MTYSVTAAPTPTPVQKAIANLMGRPLIQMQDKWLFQKLHHDASAVAQVGTDPNGFEMLSDAVTYAQKAAKETTDPKQGYGDGYIVVEAANRFVPLLADYPLLHKGPVGGTSRYNQGYRSYTDSVKAAVDGYAMLVKNLGRA